MSYRLEQAVETLHEASLLLDQSAWRGAQNRAYYAMFYAVLALLATRQLSSSKHSGVLGLFDREFVKPGLLPKELSRSLRLAFNRRQSWDYGEVGELDPEEITEMVAEAKLFVQAIEEFLREGGFGKTGDESLPR
ncbi:MAG TPA: HEPN domain-containing protein [Thermoanaerobaculia bacterium]